MYGLQNDKKLSFLTNSTQFKLIYISIPLVLVIY